MLRVRYAHERGKSHPAIHWLRGYHSFSFADCYKSPELRNKKLGIKL